MPLSEKIRELREGRGWSTQMLADQLNCSTSTINGWERGSKIPNAYNLLALSILFRVTMDELLGRKEVAPDES